MGTFSKAASLAAAVAVVAGATQAKTVFEENFRFYSDFTPGVTRDPGLLIGCDGVWELYAQLDCNATKPLDVFVTPVALPAGNKFNMTFRFQLRGDAKNKVPSFFDLVFTDAKGKRETIRIANDNFGGTPVEFVGGGWKNFGLKSNGKEVELWSAPDRGHEFKCVAKTKLSREAATFNIACTPGKVFTITDIRVTTADEPLMSFPVEKHFADFKSLSQPIANAKTAAGGETISLGGSGCTGVTFIMGATNRTVQIGYIDKEGQETLWTGCIGDMNAEKRDACIDFGRSPLGYQWVRPNMRPFTENAETGQRGMVPSGYDVLREWNRLPSASQHRFNIEFHPEANGGWTAYIDGSRVARLDNVKEFVFKPSAGVKYAVRACEQASKIDRSRFKLLDLSTNPRAKAMAGAELKGVKPGVASFEGAPIMVAAPLDSADVAICRQGKGNWALEVEEYHGRHPSLGFPMAIHYRVPAAEYAKAHILFALDPAKDKDAILTVRLGRYETNGVGGNMMGDTVLDYRGGVPESCKKVGEVKVRGETVPLYYAEVPIKVGRILDLAARTNDYLDFEFTGKGWENFQQLDNSMKPDPNSTSAFNIFGVTLEKAPFTVSVKEAQPGNIFTADEKGRKTAFEILAGTANAAGVVQWVARDLDGKEALKGERKWSVAKAGDATAVDIPLDALGKGWYALDVTFADKGGRPLFTHEAAVGVMPEAGRVDNRHDSPYAVWWFNCHGSIGTPEVGGPILQKAGIRKFSWNSFKQEDHDKYGTTSCGNFMPLARNASLFDNEKLALKEGAEQKIIDNIREQVAKMPKDVKPHALYWHESAPGAFICEELLDMPVPDKPPYPMAKADAAYLNELSRILKKNFPGIPLQIGNSTWSAGAVIGPMRNGAKPETYDRVGIETPSQVVVPERLLDCGIQGMHIAMDSAEAISGKRVKCNGTWEFTYRTERDLGLKQQAEWYMRDILISLANDFYLISPGIFFDCSSGYYNGLWGGSGLMYRAPWVYPKPAIVAYGVLTKALDGVKFTRQLDTGSTTVYALEFRRKDGKYATAIWASRGDVEFAVDSPAPGTVVHMLGAEEKLAKGESVVKGGTSPSYIITDKPLKGVVAGARSYPKAEKILAGAKVAAALDDADAIELVPDPWLESNFHDVLPYLKPSDDFTLKTVEDEEKGKCVELALGVPKVAPKGKFSDRYITRYTTMRLKEPKPIEGRPAVLGVWVKGDSNWGQIRFEIEDANGEVFKNQSTGRWWMCDIMDWPGNLAVNFDGWSYCYCSLLDNSLIIERSPGTVAEQWVSEGGDKKLDFPVKLRAISVGVNRSKLDLIDFKPATNVLRFKDMGGTEDL